jgi:diketogulonate reductase-like aldo/keto reductase
MNDNRHEQTPRTRVPRRTFLRAARDVACVFAMAPLLDRSSFAQAHPSPMFTRKIPSTDETLPAVGLGTWQTFDPPSLDDASLRPLEQVLQTFFDLGGRVVDSSPMYGKAEQVTGDLSTQLKINDRLFIAAKVWTRGKDAGVKQMEASYQKLGRAKGKLDLIQVHNLVDWLTHLTTLRDWKQRGRVRYIGVTHYVASAFDQLEQIMSNESIDFVQLPYSLAMRKAEEKLLPLAKDKGIAVLVNRPFEEGALFSKVKGKELPEFARAFAGSWAEAFLKFILANEAVTSVIPATDKVTHLRDNMSAGTGRLPDENERKKLIEFVGA